MSTTAPTSAQTVAPEGDRAEPPAPIGRGSRRGRRRERRRLRNERWTEPRRRGWLRLLLTLASGLAVGLSWEPYGLWPLLFPGVAGLTLAVAGARPRRAFGLGYLFGLVMLVLAIGWIHVLGVPVAVALIAFEALFFALLGLALTLVSRLRAVTRFSLWPVGAAAAWVLVEFGYARFPFGGFGWTRIAYPVVDTPLAGYLPFVGVAGVSFLTALLGQLLAWVLLRWLPWGRRQPSRRTGRGTLGALGAAVLVAAVVVGVGVPLRGWEPEPAAGTQGSVNVGIVQGNVPGRGIEAMGRARTVTLNHLSQTIDLATDVRLGRVPRPDFILWPENSTDIDPTEDAQTRLVVDAAARIAGVPIMVGAVMDGPGPDERQTSALFWQPGGTITGRYDKRNLVPFGEWIPFRDQLLPLIPMLKLVGAQSVPGTRPGVMRVTVPTADGGTRPLAVGDVICFELAYDATVHQAITAGAQVLMVQSNNATYGGTGQIEQQFAITRTRAMETRREIAVATTNSVSGFIDRDGTVVWRSQQFTHADRVVTMPLRSAITPAVRWGSWIDDGLALVGLLAALVGAGAAVLVRRRTAGRLATDHRTGQDGPTSQRPDAQPATERQGA